MQKPAPAPGPWLRSSSRAEKAAPIARSFHIQSTMARRQKAQVPENHERWLISYADFITLLFAFFVVMFATSHADKQKAREVSASVKVAFEQGKMPKAFMDMMGRRPPPSTNDPRKEAAKPQPEDTYAVDAAKRAMAELMPSLQSLTDALKNEIAEGKVSVNMEPRGLVVSLKEAAFFPPAADTIETSAYPTIQKIADAALRLPNRVLLEGHTDSTPISNGRFRSNWDLSAARAIAMLAILNERFSVPIQRLSVSGYADTVPVASNESADGRQKNRRVDVVFLNAFGTKSQPLLTPSAGANEKEPEKEVAAPVKVEQKVKASLPPPAASGVKKPSPFQ
jgi:chemotaxis protein MotB